MALLVLVLSVGMIVYAYAGYPLLLALLARLRPRPLHHAAHTPSVTLLIAAYNEADIIARKLDNSLSLDYPVDRLQILVAADGSDDKTPQIVSGYADWGVVLSYQPARQGKMAAINRAIPQATGDIVVFSDANNLYRPDTLRELVQPFADPQVGATTGAKQIVQGDGALGESEGLYWRYESFIKQQETLVDSCIGAAGEVMALRRTLFEPPPAEIINDDFYMALRVLQKGYRVVYVPTARSLERVSPTAQDEVTRRTRIVAGRYQAMLRGRDLLPWHRPLLLWQIISHKYLRPLVPFAMMTAFLANWAAIMPGAAATRKPLYRQFAWLGLSLQLLFYTLSLLGSLLEVGGKVGKLLYLPTYLVQSNAAALIGLARFVAGRQTTRWQRVARRTD